MSTPLCILSAVVSLAGVAGGHQAPVRVRSLLQTVADIPLPGPAVRFDYQSIDPVANLLYVAHMNAGELVVFNLTTRRIERRIGNLPRVTGVCAVPALGKVYASVPGNRQVAVIDARTFHVESRVGNIGFPDGIAYAPVARKVYVSDESGGGELVIDGPSNRVVTVIPLGGEAGNSVYDPGSGHVLVAIQSRNQIVEIDPRADRIVGRHSPAGAEHPHGMAIDPVRGLLFVANEGSATVLALDLKSWKTVDRQRVGDDPDVLAFDPGWGRLYVASESGRVSVFSEGKAALVREGEITMPHAHTVSVDPRTHLVYFPLQNVDGHPVLRVMAPRRP